MSAVLEIYRGTVNSWECDVNGHLNVQFYIGKTSEGMSHLRAAIGLTPQVIAETGRSFAAVEALIHYRQELHAGEPMHVALSVIRMTDKSMTVCADVIRSVDGALAARQEITVVSFDLKSRRSMPWADEQRARIAALLTEPPPLLHESGTGGPSMPPPGIALVEPVLTARSGVAAWECDELGHMSVQFYMDRVSDAVDHIASLLGLTPAERARRNLGTAALEYRIRFFRELRAGEAISMHSGMLGFGGRTFRYGHVLREDAGGRICATFDSVGCCIDMERRQAVPLPDDLRARAAQLFIAWPPQR